MPLKHNYRSYQEILDFATSVRNKLIDGSHSILDIYDSEIWPSDIIAERGEGGYMLVENFESFMNFRKEVARELSNYKYQILVRSNKMVREINKLGFDNVTTIHKAKGLEFENVIVADFEINDEESINVAFVALTRAQNREIVINFETLLMSLGNLPQEVVNKQRNIVSAF